jgi:O-antigen ligase
LLALALCAYLAAPLFDIPVLGLSLSSPLVGFITLALLTKEGGVNFRRMPAVSVFVVVMLAGMTVGLMVRVLTGDGLPQYVIGLKKLLLFSYWMGCMVLGCHLFGFTTLPRRAPRWMAWAVTIMALAIFGEFLLFGGLQRNGWSRFTEMSQNIYGWQFSTFLPFVYLMVVSAKGRRRLWWWGATGLCLVAVVVLSSRTTWATTALGLTLFGALYGFVTRRVLAVAALLFVAVVFGASGWFLAPEALKSRMVNDAQSLENLERDKSWQGRLVQVQKGLALFKENPVFGAGLGQFKYTGAEVDMPDVYGGGKSVIRGTSSHNSYIQLLAEGGLMLTIPFALLLVWLVGAGGWTAIGMARQGEWWGLALVVGLVGMSVHFWTLSGLTGTAPWFVYGTTAGMIYRERHRHRVLSRKEVKRHAPGISLSHPR